MRVADGLARRRGRRHPWGNYHTSCIGRALLFAQDRRWTGSTVIFDIALVDFNTPDQPTTPRRASGAVDQAGTVHWLVEVEV